jgi:hypothetical protein
MTGPREQYAAARRKAQARKPADPQSVTAVIGGPAAPAAVTAMMRPCRAEVPAGLCGHTGYEHATGTRRGREVRTACSIATAAGPCGCRAYTPARTGTPMTSGSAGISPGVDPEDRPDASHVNSRIYGRPWREGACRTGPETPHHPTEGEPL